MRSSLPRAAGVLLRRRVRPARRLWQSADRYLILIAVSAIALADSCVDRSTCAGIRPAASRTTDDRSERASELASEHLTSQESRRIKQAHDTTADETSRPVHDTDWPRHTIDDSSRGADGVRLADVNRDGLLDVVTGWEEGGIVRVYVHPGQNKVRQKWPATTVGHVRSPEDAVPVDLDGDGAVDVVSSCEGANRTVYVHWAPQRQRYHEPTFWKTQPIPVTAGKQMWMYALPMDMDGQAGVDLLVGSKGPQAAVGWLQSPPNPRELTRWQYHKLYDAGWIMSLAACDLDRDGDVDVVVSDRKGDHSGVYWLQNHAPSGAGGLRRWQKHNLGRSGKEVMFVDVADVDGDGRLDVVAAVKPNMVLLLTQPESPERTWPRRRIHLPTQYIGTAKAARVGDVNQDGEPDIVFSCEEARPPKVGVFWLSSRNARTDGRRDLYDISGAQGVKYDRIELIDLDQDGDLDVLTCEERDNLGVIWYENPTRKSKFHREGAACETRSLGHDKTD